ncbi:MAG: OmpA family protein [Spirochaetes bacterium]|nr:OmpA family protein [Spirochaetota bacterium]
MKPFLLACFLSAVSLMAADWPLYRGNMYFTGNNDDAVPSTNRAYFSLKADSAIHTPIAVDGFMYFTTLRGFLYRVDEETGDLRMKRRIESNVTRPILLVGERLLTGEARRVVCHDRRRGTLLWASAEVPEGLEGFLAADGTMLLVGTPNRLLFLNLKDGRPQRPPIDLRPGAPFPIPYGDGIYLVSRQGEEATLRALDLAQAQYRWNQALPKGSPVTAPLIFRDRIFLACGDRFAAFALSNGSPVFNEPLGAAAADQPVVYGDGAVVLLLQDGSLATFDGKTGKRLRSIPAKAVPASGLAVIRESAYIVQPGKEEGGKARYQLTGIDLGSGRSVFEWSSPGEEPPRGVIASSGRLLVATGDTLYSVGQDGNAWFGAPRSLEFTRDPPVRTLVSTNITQRVTNVVIRAHTVTNRPAKNQPKEIAYNFYGSTWDEAKIQKVPARTNVVTNWLTNLERRSEALEIVLFPPRPKPEVPSLVLSLQLKDHRSNELLGRVELISRENRRIIDRKLIESNQDLASISIPRPGETEILASAEGHMDNKVVLTPADKGTNQLQRVLYLTRIETGKSIVVENIHFEVEKATLLAESAAILDRVRDTLMANPKLVVEVRGFTDSQGAEEYNRALSLRRAQSVREYLIKKGLPQERLTAKGLGPLNPIADNRTEAGRAKNRRTEFYILSY